MYDAHKFTWQALQNSWETQSKVYNCIEWKSVTMIGENRQLLTDEPVEFEK